MKRIKVVLAMLAVAVAAIAVSGCGGSNEQEKTSASIEPTVEQDITKAETFNKLFRDLLGNHLASAL